MHKVRKLIVTAAAVIGITASFATVAGAQVRHGSWGHGQPGVVFVQTDNVAGNQVVAYDRSGSGVLTPAGTYDTAGLGGVQNGSAVDHLASQGSLNLDASHQLLFAVNAGSNSISVFRVDGDRLWLRQVIGSGGTFPSSITSSGDSVVVLNAQDGGSIVEFRVLGDRLVEIPGSTRQLGLVTPTDATQFTHTPGQVAFTPDGRQLVVTTKATTSAIDVFGVGPFGWLSQSPTVNVEPGAVPFAVAFGPDRELVVANAQTNSVSSYRLGWDGTATLLGTTATSQAATCWVVGAGTTYFASNAGSGSLSAFGIGGGAPALLGQTTTDPGTVDAATTPDGRYLYVQTGLNGIVDEFSVGAGGSLSSLGSVKVPDAAGGEGIVAI